MNPIPDLPPVERRHFLRRAALAPLCLLLVAGLHAARVWTARQTPWKGGGFGMFSTIDSEGNRFLRAYLITGSGELPLPLPAALDKPAAEQRAAPSVVGLKSIARRLAAQDWRWTDDRQRRQAQAISQRDGLEISAAALRCPSSVTAAPLSAGQSHALEPLPRSEPSLSLPLGAGRGEGLSEAIPFTAVRLECWRGRFDAATDLLSAERLLSVTVTREEARP